MFFLKAIHFHAKSNWVKCTYGILKLLLTYLKGSNERLGVVSRSKVIWDRSAFGLLRFLMGLTRKLTLTSAPFGIKGKTDRHLVTRVYPCFGLYAFFHVESSWWYFPSLWLATVITWIDFAILSESRSLQVFVLRKYLLVIVALNHAIELLWNLRRECL